MSDTPDQKLKYVLEEAISAIYFDDNSDYSRALWAIIRKIDPEAAKLLLKDASAAYTKHCKTEDTV